MTINKSNQRGFSLIEVIIATAILSITLTAMVSAIQQIIQRNYNQVDASMIFEDDLIVRYEIQKILQIFQREIVKRLPSTSRNLNTVKKFQCSNPWILMDNIQTGTFIDHPIGSRRVYFGRWEDLIAGKVIPDSTKIVESQMKLFKDDSPFTKVLGASPANLFSKPKFAEASSVHAAYKRCLNQSIGKNVKSINGRSTIYMCGFGVGFLLEVQATFWDSNIRKSMNCEDMNLVSGRGIQAIYKVYGFAGSKYKKTNNPKSSGFVFKSYGGRLYIPKDIFYGE